MRTVIHTHTYTRQPHTHTRISLMQLDIRLVHVCVYLIFVHIYIVAIPVRAIQTHRSDDLGRHTQKPISYTCK